MPTGHRLSVAELSGRSVNYTYDNIYRLTSETIAGDTAATPQNGAISYTYDAVGNRQQRASTVPAIPAIPAGVLFYDANDRTTGSADAYDANGNTTGSAGFAVTYDFENRLVKREDPAVANDDITIKYNGDGERVEKRVQTGASTFITTTYLVDDRNPTGYSQVLVETTGSLSRQYVYGLDLISQRRQLTSTTFEVRYFGYDGHGSTRFLTDSAAAVTDTFDYDAFGNLITRTGTTPTHYLYAGEQFDADLNLYYNRARYLDVRTGRFWSMDPSEGTPQDPLSLHKYLYASLDPLNAADPTGNFTLSEISVSAGIGGVLSAAMTGYIYQDHSGPQFWNEVGLSFLGGAALSVAGGFALKLAVKAAAPLLRSTFTSIFRTIGSLDPIKLTGKQGAEKLLIRISRFFLNTNRNYPRIGETPVGRILQRLFPRLDWENHHVIIQQAWTRVGGPSQIFDDVLANEGLRRVGNGLWNLFPLPAEVNRLLAGTRLGTALFATAYYGAIAFGTAFFLEAFDE